MNEGREELPRGALEMLVLKSLSGRKRHGYAVVRAIRDKSAGALAVEEGSVYPALHRMERRGWLASAWGATDTGRRAKFYALTPAGRKRLREARASWLRTTRAIELVLGGHAAEA